MEGHILAEKYEITRLLGRGGMGAVYEARNHLGKRLAVKLLLNPELARDHQLVERFFREAKASAAIESEHIVEVYDTGVDPGSGFPFIVMEMLKGEDLEHTILRVGALDSVAAARIASQAADGLAEAHAAGIIHRDVKPANIFMSMRGHGDLVVKILDFGIAKQVEQLQGQSARLTKTGSMLGTPLYMSPEQARGLRTIDARSDIWSLGICLYEALAGHTPWGSVETLGDLIIAICTRNVLPLHEVAPWVSRELSALVERMLARDPQLRTPSCRALIDELARFCGNGVALTPALLIGVSEEHRTAAIPPRLARGTISGSASMSASQVVSTAPLGQTGQRTLGEVERKSRAAMYTGIGAVTLALVTGSTIALVKTMRHPSENVTAVANVTNVEPAHDDPALASSGPHDSTPTVIVTPPSTTAAIAAATDTLPIAPTANPAAVTTGKIVTNSTAKMVISAIATTKSVNGASSGAPPIGAKASSATSGATPSKPKDNGETCAVDSQCASQTCVAGRCSRKISDKIE